MTRSLDDDILREPVWLALAFFLIAAATILGALAFEHIGGYQPCALCLQERVPYYAGMPLAALAAITARHASARTLTILLFAALCLLALYNTGLGIYHSGVEWKVWEGPAACAPSDGALTGGSILDAFRDGVRPPSCTDALWRFAGLSFAGWNAVVSIVLAGIAGLGAWRVYGSSSASQ